MMSSKRSFLENRHPLYQHMIGEWEFLAQSYEGGPTYAKGENLFRFPREPETSFKERKRRVDRVNYTKTIVDLVIDYLTKEQAARAAEPPPDIALFWEDVDGHGTGIHDFAASIAARAVIFGRVYVVVDKPAETAESRQDEIDRRLAPYAYMVDPRDVLDVVFSQRTGEIEQIMIRERVRGEIDLLEGRDDDKLSEQFRIWKQTPGGVEWFLFVEDNKGREPKLIEKGILDIPQVPILAVSRGDDVYTGDSLIADVATLDRTVYNYNSLLDQILYDQTFSTLILPWGALNNEFYDKWEKTLGTKSIFPYPPDANPPAYISPDASQGALIADSIRNKISQIFQVRNLQSDGNVKQEAASQESGVAKAYDFEKLNAGLAKLADMMERAEERMLSIVLMWQGKRGDDMKVGPELVDYPDKFDVKTLIQELTEFNALYAASISETFNKLLKKSLVAKTMPKLEEDIKKQIEAEIDAGSFDDPEKNQQAEADRLAGKGSPPGSKKEKSGDKPKDK